MVPAQPNTWACAWKLSIDLSSLPKGWLRFHAGLEGCCSSHNYSQMVFPPVRTDSNICVLPLLVKYNHHSSSPEVLSSLFCNVKKKRITWLDHWGGDPGWVTGWHPLICWSWTGVSWPRSMFALSSLIVSFRVAGCMAQGTKLTWRKKVILTSIAASR